MDARWNRRAPPLPGLGALFFLRYVDLVLPSF
jgi:hypothetical protein